MFGWIVADVLRLVPGGFAGPGARDIALTFSWATTVGSRASLAAPTGPRSPLYGPWRPALAFRA